MRLLSFCLVIAIIATTVSATVNPDQLRGVKKRDYALYSGATFTCRDGSHTIPSTQINDDYCDCMDGSDEPGTNACINGQFWCTNKGGKGKLLPSSRINDGICDCCDGSDEWSSTTKCSNTCEQEGRAAQQGILDEIAATEQGWAIRQEWINQGRVKAEETRKKLASLEQKLIERQAKLDAAKQVKEAEEEAERIEKEKRAAEKAAKQGVTTDATATDATTDGSNAAAPAATNEPAVPATNEVAKPADASTENFPYPAEYAFKGEEKKEEQENFPYPAEYAYNKDAEKTTDQLHAELAATEKELAAVTGDDTTVEATYKDEEAEYVSEDDVERELADPQHVDEESEEEDDDVIPSFFSTAFTELSSFLSHTWTWTKERTHEYAMWIADYFEWTKSPAQQARDAYDAAQRKVTKMQNKVNELKKQLENDYGNEGEFTPLQGKCFDMVNKQYTYEICPYDESKQKEGHSATSLGRWTGIERAADGRIAFKFENGQSCWQGPQRSMKVWLQCGADNKVISVEETSKCVYEMKFATPAVCNIQHAQALKLNLETGGLVDEEEQ